MIQLSENQRYKYINGIKPIAISLRFTDIAQRESDIECFFNYKFISFLMSLFKDERCTNQRNLYLAMAFS